MAENNAEWVTGWVSEDPESCLTFTWDPSGAKSEQLLLGLVGIAHANVEMQLLRIRRVRPAERNPFGDLLECELAGAHTLLR